MRALFGGLVLALLARSALGDRCERSLQEDFARRRQKILQIQADLQVAKRKSRDLEAGVQERERRELAALQRRVGQYRALLEEDRRAREEEARAHEERLLSAARRDLDDLKAQLRRGQITTRRFNSWQRKRVTELEAARAQEARDLAQDLQAIDARGAQASVAEVAGADKIHATANASRADCARQRAELAGTQNKTDALAHDLEAQRAEACERTSTTTTSTTSYAPVTSEPYTTTTTTTLWKDELNQPPDWHALWDRMDDILHRVFMHGLTE